MNRVSGSSHGSKDLIRAPVAANVAEAAREPSRHYGSAGAEQSAQKV